MASGRRRLLSGLLSSTELTYSRCQHRSTAVAATLTDKMASTQSTDVRQWKDLPGPTALTSYLGAANIFMRKKQQENLHLLTKNLVHRYGKLVRLQLKPPERMFGIASPSLMEEITRHEDPLPKREAPRPWAEYLRKHGVTGGLLTSQEEDWSNKRKAVRGLMLKPFAMEDFIPVIEKLAEDFCKQIEYRRDNSGYVDSLPLHLYRFSFDGILSIMFGESGGCLAAEGNKRGDEFIDAVSVILEGCFNSLMIFASEQQRYNMKTWRKHEQAWDKAKESTEYYMERMINNLQSSSLGFTPMASSLLANPALSKLDTEFMLLEFLFGGVDTSSNSLGFVLHNLASHPDKQEKLRAEILEHSDNLDIHVIQSMKYLNACIKESSRLHPILFVNGRVIRKDFVSKDGIQFKTEDRTLFFHYYMCRDPDIWANPDQFIPERFDRSTTTKDSPVRKLVSIPFGFGTRGCIGKRIAEAEMALCIIKVISRFDLSLDKSRPALQPHTRALLTPGKQIPIKFKDRMKQ